MKATCAMRRLAVLGSLVLLGCPPPVTCTDPDECPDGGVEIPDVCNSREEALSDPQCALTPGEGRTAYVSFSKDQDWYLAQLPGNLTARSLLHVTGGYSAPNTAVNLAINILEEDGQTSVARAVDKHGQSAPRPIDIVLPYSKSNAKLLVLVGDEQTLQKPPFDVKSPYSVKFSVQENPDTNEPNDATPTPLNLANQGGALTGTATGYLATADDVDRFSFAAPAGRKVIYLHLTAPRKSPPPPYRLSYILLDPTGKQVSEGQATNEFIAADLATARLATAGTYTVVVQGYRAPNVPGAVPGDIDHQYTLEVRVLDEVDATEPNDTPATARVVTLGSAGASQSVTARLGYVPDPDWFAVDLPATGAPTVFRYRLREAGGGGRFSPLAPVPDRQVRVVTEVTQGATLADRQNACKTDSSVCPKGYEAGNDTFPRMVESVCNATNPPQCLRSERNETPEFNALKNFEGAIPVPANTSMRLLLVVQDDGNNYADDRDYGLELRRTADADESSHGPGQVETATLQQSGSFPAPSGNEFTGTLSHGYGRVLHHDWNRGEGVRGPEDYDAIFSDSDRYELVFPAIGAPEDRTWALQWELTHADGGRPYDLGVEVVFCTGTGADGGCSSKGVLAYDDRQLQTWYGPRGTLWDLGQSASATTVTATPTSCLCFQPKYVRGGRFFLNVHALDRNSYDDTQYRLRMSFTGYPQSYTGDGGTASCPVAGADGGTSCGFGE